MVWSRRSSSQCELLGERWCNPPSPVWHPTTTSSPPNSPGLSSEPTLSAKGNETVSSLCSFLSEIYGLALSLFLYVMIKYCLSAQWIPKAKGKSLCPHIICKLSLSPRTDLFTGTESVLYYPVVTLPCLSFLFNVMLSHSRSSV